MWITVAVIVLIIVALLAYFVGHRQGQAWGKPLLALAVVGLVVVVAYRIASGPPRGDRLPAYVQEVQHGYIDEETGELVLLPGHLQDGPLKNPKTGKKTLWPA